MARSFLDEVKTRMEDAQRRAHEISTRLQEIQQQHQSVMQELASYQKIVQLETIRLQSEEQQQLIPQVSVIPIAQPLQRPLIEAADEINKTEAIRELLRSHPTGMTPSQIWQTMKSQVTHRQYIYSVLKRLKDKRQVTERRGRYYFQSIARPEETTESVVLQ